MNDLISVLMCVYNTPEAYLREAIESILGQTYSNIEFIIVNDCSTSETTKKCLLEYRRLDNRITLLDNEQNLGLTKSLNVGLAVCNGKYIARMDSDDISLADRLREQAEYLDNNTDVALVGSNIICFGNDISEIDTSDISDEFKDFESYRIHSLMHHSGPPHPTFMFRTQFIKEYSIRYREDVMKAQDYGIMVDILKCNGIIKKLDRPLLKYRIHSNQISSESGLEQKIYQCKVSMEYIHFLFPEMSINECIAIALLGCSDEIRNIEKALKYNDKLAMNCSDLNDNISQLNSPSLYIKAQKKLLGLNKKKKIYNEKKLEILVKAKWWKKVIRHNKEYHDFWGLRLYTLWCYMLGLHSV